MAMGITLADNRVDLVGHRLFLEDRGLRFGPIVWGPRIGIRVGTERPWRAYVEGHPAVSGNPPARTRRRASLSTEAPTHRST
jgi:DNA-3-methyladenine glycosylase